MHVWPPRIELPVGIFDISRCTFAYFWFKRMLTSLAHMRPSGGLLGEICNIIKVLECFLRGYIEAMLVVRSDECELAVFSNSWKVDFCGTSNEKSMILNLQVGNMWSSETLNGSKPIWIYSFELFRLGLSNPQRLVESMPPPGGGG